MPRKKKTETAPVTTEVKAETVKEEVVETPAPIKEKPTARKTSPKTTKAKTTTKAVTAPKETVKIQFGGDEYDFADIKKAVEADYQSKAKDKIKTIEIYIKSEDRAVYYVVNAEFSDKIEL